MRCEGQLLRRTLTRENGPFYRRTLFSRKEFPITDTELKDMAALAITGLRRIPKKG